MIAALILPETDEWDLREGFELHCASACQTKTTLTDPASYPVLSELSWWLFPPWDSFFFLQNKEMDRKT